MVSKVTRFQLHVEHSAGEWVTSTQMTFGGLINEYLTTHTLAFLMGCSHVEICNTLERNGIEFHEEHGHNWVVAWDVMAILALRPPE